MFLVRFGRGSLSFSLREYNEAQEAYRTVSNIMSGDDRNFYTSFTANRHLYKIARAIRPYVGNRYSFVKMHRIVHPFSMKELHRFRFSVHNLSASERRVLSNIVFDHIYDWWEEYKKTIEEVVESYEYTQDISYLYFQTSCISIPFHIFFIPHYKSGYFCIERNDPSPWHWYVKPPYVEDLSAIEKRYFKNRIIASKKETNESFCVGMLATDRQTLGEMINDLRKFSRRLSR